MAEDSPHIERLQGAVEAVSRLLETYARRHKLGDALLSRVSSAESVLGAPVDGSALDAMVDWFNLTPFELAVVVLAAGIEIAPDLAGLCAVAQGDPAIPYPTMLLTLAAFAGLDGASQAAFIPASPLRFWPLITAEPGPGSSRLQQRIGIPNAVLSLLVGQPAIDEAASDLIRLVEKTAPLPSDIAFARELGKAFAEIGSSTAIHLVSPPTARARGVAAETLAALGFTPFHLPLAELAAELTRPDLARPNLPRLWQRDRLGFRGALIVFFEETPAEAHLAALDRLLGEGPGPMILVGPGGQIVAERLPHPILRVPLPPSEPEEVAARLAAVMDCPASPALHEMAERFRLPLPVLESCARVARIQAEAAPSDTPASLDTILARLLPLLRNQVREAMAGLADPVPVRMSFDDLILPADARAVLDQIVARQRNRGLVLDQWGFRRSGGGAQGMSVLFAGPSGTGKTMAAEALAQALRLDLYRVDLSRIVDKYIGETEKRLSSLFDAADSSDAILLFDEADVLFGRRTEVRDSHDHYANLEVGYLLQRIESFRGIAILTTNLPNAIDDAFSRRLAFSLHFEFPSPDERRRIWRRAFPAQAPTAELDWDRLARLSLSGGQIRVVVVNAAMLAAEAGDPIGMPHIARALVSEYSKQRRRVPPAELEGWPT